MTGSGAGAVTRTGAGSSAAVDPTAIQAMTMTPTIQTQAMPPRTPTTFQLTPVRVAGWADRFVVTVKNVGDEVLEPGPFEITVERNRLCRCTGE